MEVMQGQLQPIRALSDTWTAGWLTCLISDPNHARTVKGGVTWGYVTGCTERNRGAGV